MASRTDGFIDLHIHSACSDGGFGRPYDALRKAAQLGLRAVSLTEHDSIDSIPEAADAARRFGVEYITGVEITAHNRRRALSYHLLSYMFDPEHPAVQTLMGRVRRALQYNLKRVLVALEARGQPVTWDQLVEKTAQIYPYLPGREPDWHVLNEMFVDLGYAPDLDAADLLRVAAFKEAGKIVAYPDQSLVFETFKKAGGLLFMAHPQAFIRNHFAPAMLLAELVADGLDGVEAYSPKHDKTTERFYRRLARHVGCIVSGGGDCHDVTRPLKEINMGRRRVPYLVLERMRHRYRVKYGKPHAPLV
jgi:predicted metal-dependent phosphoesterase TrpH